MPAKMLRTIAVAAVCFATGPLPSPPDSRAMRRRPLRGRLSRLDPWTRSRQPGVRQV